MKKEIKRAIDALNYAGVMSEFIASDDWQLVDDEIRITKGGVHTNSIQLGPGYIVLNEYKHDPLTVRSLAEYDTLVEAVRDTIKRLT